MKIFNKTILGAVIGAAIIAGVAYAASTTAPTLTAPARAAADAAGTPVTVTWELPNDNNPVSTSTGITTEYSVGDELSINSNATYQEQTFSSYHSTAQTKLVNEKQFVKFTLTSNKAFELTNIKYQLANQGWGDGRYTLIVKYNDKSLTLKSEETPDRNNTNTKIVETSNDVSNVVVEAGTPIEVIFYLHCKKIANDARDYMLRNVVLSGVEYGEGSELPETAPEGWATIPGTLSTAYETDWVRSGNIKLESNGSGFGSIKNGAYATTNFFCAREGAYSMNVNFSWLKDGCTSEIKIEVIDQASGLIEAKATHMFSVLGVVDIPLNGVITKGKKTFKISFFDNGHGQYITNFNAPTFTRTGEGEALDPADQMSCIPGTLPLTEADWTMTGCKIENSGANVGYVVAGGTAKTRFYCKKAGVYSLNENFNWYQGNAGTFRVEIKDVVTGNVEATCSQYVDALMKVDMLLEGIITEGVKEMNVYMESTKGGNLFNWTPPVFTWLNDGTVDASIIGVTVDGREADVLEALAAEKTASITGQVYTTMPVVVLSTADGRKITAEGTLEGTTATYTATVGEDTYTLTVEGVKIYNRTADDLSVNLKWNEGTCSNNVWTNSLYTVSGQNDGYNQSFKWSTGATITIGVPVGRLVKQLIIHEFANNYDKNPQSHLGSVTGAEGVTFDVPSNTYIVHSSEGPAIDVVVNVHDYVLGTPIVVNLATTTQSLGWFELVYEDVALTTPVEVTGFETTPLEGCNHAVVTFSFDREITGATATFEGRELTAEGGSSVARFSLWNLEYGTDYEIVLTSAKDIYGNDIQSPEAHTLTCTEPTFTPVTEDRFLVVSTAEQLRAAVTAIKQMNEAKDSPMAYVYILNGEYDMGTEELRFEKCYNVSMIGESRDGVLIYGSRSGISNPVFSTRGATNIYMANFTVKNNWDNNPETGVAVAHYGGNLDIMQNVRLLSATGQDTQVTGERGYYFNCEIHGTVDYICGGGDQFYENCTFVNERDGSCVTAPNTSSANKHGYVFQNCTIKGNEGYHLGRPWDNEPRCYWLYTTMEALAHPDGWTKMAKHVTHFYEYNSKDANGNLIDLSTRKNSPDHVGDAYTPILSAEQADYFTVENVLGGTDSWLPTERTNVETHNDPITVNYWSDDNEEYLHWDAVEGAIGYMIYKGGKYVKFVAAEEDVEGQTYMIRSNAPAQAQHRALAMSDYSVAAVNANGVAGKATEGFVSGVNDIMTAEGGVVEYYNLQGIRVADDARGTLIRVATVNGTRTAVKVVK